MNHSPSTSASGAPQGDARPCSPLHLAGSLLCRIIVPLWLLAGAIFKLVEMNPKLLPPQVLAVVEWFASVVGTGKAQAYAPALRLIVGTEVALALVMILAPRLSRLVAGLVLALFCTLLTMILFSKGGSCGCFGAKGPSPAVMLSIDGAMLLGVLLLPNGKPCCGPKHFKGTLIAIGVALVAGGVVALAAPQPKVMQLPDSSEPGSDLGSGSDAGSSGASGTTSTPEPPDSGAGAASSSGATSGDAAGATAAGTSGAASGTPSNVIPWPGMPATAQPYYVFEPSEWLNTRFDSHEMARLIQGLTINPNQGRLHVVFMREDCDHCHKLLENHFRGALTTPALTVVIPDSTGRPLPNPCDACAKAKFFMTGGQPIYMVTTPVLMTLQDGVVIAICADADDDDQIVQTLEAGSQP